MVTDPRRLLVRSEAIAEPGPQAFHVAELARRISCRAAVVWCFEHDVDAHYLERDTVYIVLAPSVDLRVLTPQRG